MMATLCEMNPQERQNLLLYMAHNMELASKPHNIAYNHQVWQITKNTNVIEFSCTNRPTYFSRGQPKENHAIS
jgi:hypothetical protein